MVVHDDVIDGGHDEFDLRGVGGAGEVRVDVFCFRPGLVHEAVEDVVAGGLERVVAQVVGEQLGQRRDEELLFEHVDLVQEEDDRRVDEPARVADRVEEREGLLHPVDVLVLEEHLVVLGDGDEEDDGRHVVEAVDPLFPLGPLPANVKQPVDQAADVERGLRDPGRLHAGAEDVLVRRDVVVLRDPLDRIEEAARARRGGATHARTPPSAQRASSASTTGGEKLSQSIWLGNRAMARACDAFSLSSGMRSVVMASRMARIDWTVFENITSLNAALSSSLIPPS
ncbi:MAG: hypothetical protein BJ554DRAFT_8207 [Olpidium bornovanus]|uniref:Uncharacterized protein n=1 Tax=Olpidium bornovanus TaxID=278681 RepID=A0A8H8A1Q0_9FUNG|nr:MAG: hypothetical protein BJ554DRAFT_8207 [Olpidium bornovanus]